MKSLLSIIFCIFLIGAGNAFASSQIFVPATSKNSLGVFAMRSSYSDNKTEIDMFVQGDRYDASLNVLNKYGLYASYAINPYIHSYSKFSYQLIQVEYANLEEMMTGCLDNHRFDFELGLEIRLSLYSSIWNGKPLFDALFVINGGLILGGDITRNSYFNGSAVYGYDHGVSLRFEILDRFFISSGLDWNHNYSRAYAKKGKQEKNNSLMLDFDQSGSLVLNAGIMF